MNKTQVNRRWRLRPRHERTSLCSLAQGTTWNSSTVGHQPIGSSTQLNNSNPPSIRHHSASNGEAKESAETRSKLTSHSSHPHPRSSLSDWIRNIFNSVLRRCVRLNQRRIFQILLFVHRHRRCQRQEQNRIPLNRVDRRQVPAFVNNNPSTPRR